MRGAKFSAKIAQQQSSKQFNFSSRTKNVALRAKFRLVKNSLNWHAVVVTMNCGEAIIE